MGPRKTMGVRAFPQFPYAFYLAPSEFSLSIYIYIYDLCVQYVQSTCMYTYIYIHTFCLHRYAYIISCIYVQAHVHVVQVGPNRFLLLPIAVVVDRRLWMTASSESRTKQVVRAYKRRSMACFPYPPCTPGTQQ